MARIKPCGKCLSCINRFPQMCVHIPSPYARKHRRQEEPEPALVNKCNQCGATIEVGRRLCDPCRTENRRKTWAANKRKVRAVACPTVSAS